MQETLRGFLFSCLTGLAFADLSRVQRSQLASDTLIFIRHKVRRFENILQVPLTERAKNLLGHKLGHTDRVTLFNTLSLDKTNEKLTEIRRFAGINKKITTHTGRHTFGTNFIINGGSRDALKEIMGHSKYETTQIYVHLSSDYLKQQMKVMN